MDGRAQTLAETGAAIRAILLDRDGTINVEIADYVRTLEQFELLPGVMQAFQSLASMGLPVVVVTNQAGIARGLLSEETLDSIHARLRLVALSAGLKITDILVCPHHPDAGCSCRKPKPGLLLQAAAQLNLRPKECLMVGDSRNDYLAAQAAGCQVILVRSGRQGDQLDAIIGDPMAGNARRNMTPPPILANLLEAANWILEGKQRVISQDAGRIPAGR